MIVPPRGLDAERVAAAVRAGWGVQVTGAEHVPLGAGAWHWALADDDGPQWFASVDPVASAVDRQVLLAAYDAAAQLSSRLPFVVAPVRTRDAGVAVDVAPGLVLSLTPWLDGADLGDGGLDDDTVRAPVAALLGELHRQLRPRGCPVWRPRVGWTEDTGDALQRCLREPSPSGGPWAVPAARLLGDAGPVLERALRRFALLGAAVTGSMDRWVVTHGEPHKGNLRGTPDGLRLVDWSTVRLAPRERDLREVLDGADGNEPWFAYVEAGGRPDPLSPDTLELFALEWHLGEVAQAAVLFSGPHEDTDDARRCFADLEAETAALVAGWS